MSIASVYPRIIHGYITMKNTRLPKRFLCKNCFENLAIADPWDIIKVPKQFIRR